MAKVGNFLARRRPVWNPIAVLGDDLGEWYSATDLANMFTDVAGTAPAAGNGDAVAAIRAQNAPDLLMTQSNAAKRGTYRTTAFNYNTTAGIVLDFSDGQFFAVPSAYQPSNSFFGIALSVATSVGQTIFSQARTSRDSVFSVANAGWLGGFSGSYNGVSLNFTAFNEANVIALDTPYSVFVEHDGANLKVYVAQGDEDPVLASSTAVAIDPATYEVSAAIFANDTGANPAGGAWQHYVRYSRRDLTDSKRRLLNNYFREQRGSINYTLAIKATAQVGSMTAGSSVVTGLADTSGFAVGDPVVVEPNTGYSTSGPGGIFPDQSAANEAATLALTSGSGRIRAADTGKVYQPKGDGSGYYAWESSMFYDRYAIPLPLTGRVVSKTSTTLTLDTPAVSSVTSANVYFDAGIVLQGMNGPNGSTFNMPAGNFHISEGADIRGRKRWTVKGAGKTATTLNLVRGGNPRFLKYTNCIEPTTRDFKIIGGHGWDGRTSPYRISANVGDSYGSGITHWSCTDWWVYQVDFYDVALSAIDSHFSSIGTRQYTEGAAPFKTEDGRVLAGLAQDCMGGAEKADQRYINWQFNSVDNNYRVEFRDCGWQSPWLKKVFEAFRSVGTVYTRFHSVNGIGSCNSAAATEHIETYVRLTDNCRDITVLQPLSGDHYMLNLNNNIGGTSGSSAGSGGILVRPTFIQEGWLDAGGSIAMAINIYQQPGWSITGTYDPTVANDGLRKGLISAPAPKAGRDLGNPLNDSRGGPSINTSSDLTIIDGIRLEIISKVGMETPAVDGNYGIRADAVLTSLSVLQNTVSGTSDPNIAANWAAATQSNNISNAAYDAL